MNSPFARLKFPSRERANVTIDKMIMSGTSTRISCLDTTRGTIIAETPRMNNTLNILLPTTFPTAILDCPESADSMLTASSGELVPKATTVRPMTSGEMPIREATLDAPRTSDSAPIIRKISPVTGRTICIMNGSYLLILMPAENAQIQLYPAFFSNCDVHDDRDNYQRSN